MSRAIEFWGVIVGFFAGWAFVTGQDFIAAIRNPEIKALETVNYFAFVIALCVVGFLGWLFYQLEKQENERRDHNENMLFHSLNNMTDRISSMAESIDALTNEIRRDRDERNQSG